jgi:hypothetical protein
MNRDQLVKRIELVRTCEACPEQYDAMLDGKQVGYLRVRWGYFTVLCPDGRGRVVFDAAIGGSLQGCFADVDRESYLNSARFAIARWVLTQRTK